MKQIIFMLAMIGFANIGMFTVKPDISLTGYIRFQQKQGLMSIMHQNMMQLEKIKMTGDPDFDFATMMQQHHKGGMAIADEEIRSGKDSVMVKLASNIRTNQQKDLSKLHQFTTMKKPGQSVSVFVQEMKSHLQHARDEMSGHMSMKGQTDKDFILIMSLHHKHGKEMANLEIKYGKDAEMKALAQKMITEQEAGLKRMNALKNKK